MADAGATRKRRDSAATRAAIFASARELFARRGYDGAGVREIAAGAGVTAMLVNRYFGSKEQLFAEVVAATMATPDILAAGNLAALRDGDAATRMATTLLEITDKAAAPLDGFQIMLRSVGSDRAAEIARTQIDAHYQRLLTEALDGDLPAERTAVLFALIAGVQVMRQIIQLPALADADPADLLRILRPLFEALLDGPGAPGRSRP